MHMVAMRRRLVLQERLSDQRGEEVIQNYRKGDSVQAVVSEVDTDSGSETTYRLMFSGTGDESKFRIADYLFRHHADEAEKGGSAMLDAMEAEL